MAIRIHIMDEAGEEGQRITPWLVHAAEQEDSDEESDTDGEDGEEGEGGTERGEWDRGPQAEIEPERDKG